MFISLTYLAALVSFASRISGSPVENGLAATPSWSSLSGAAYFITNDPSGNKVVSLGIDPKGQICSLSSVHTGGVGVHGVTAPIGADGLFSQGSVQVNAMAKILVTVNPGSNTLSMFAINPYQPTVLTMIGKPVSSGGEFPMSVAINAKGTTVCVLNGGAVNGINCYAADKQHGLVAKPNTTRYLGLNQTTPANGPPGTTSQVIFNEDGSKLTVSVKGIPPAPGFLATWDVAADGSLSAEPVKSTPATGGLLPFSLTIIPGANALLATDPAIGFSIYDFANEKSATMGADSTIVAIPGQIATCWSTFSPTSKNYYLVDAGTATITEVNVDKNLQASIVKQYPQAAGSAPIDSQVAMIGKNSYLYVLAGEATSVDVLLVNKPGAATAVQTFNFTLAAKADGLTFDKNNLQGMATFVMSD